MSDVFLPIDRVVRGASTFAPILVNGLMGVPRVMAYSSLIGTNSYTLKYYNPGARNANVGGPYSGSVIISPDGSSITFPIKQVVGSFEVTDADTVLYERTLRERNVGALSPFFVNMKNAHNQMAQQMESITWKGDGATIPGFLNCPNTDTGVDIDFSKSGEEIFQAIFSMAVQVQAAIKMNTGVILAFPITAQAALSKTVGVGGGTTVMSKLKDQFGVINRILFVGDEYLRVGVDNFCVAIADNSLFAGVLTENQPYSEALEIMSSWTADRQDMSNKVSALMTDDFVDADPKDTRLVRDQVKLAFGSILPETNLTNLNYQMFLSPRMGQPIPVDKDFIGVRYPMYVAFGGGIVIAPGACVKSKVLNMSGAATLDVQSTILNIETLNVQNMNTQSGSETN